MICKEERLLDKFGSQPRLCDFGASLGSCPGGADCIGPGGGVFTAGNRYACLWTTRRFVAGSFLALFPEKADTIREAVQPGEYGLESYYLRIVTVYVFVLGLWSDLAGSMELGALLWHVPTDGEPWMHYEVPDLNLKSKRKHGWSELDHLRFQVAGMPLFWKLASVFWLLLPKVYIWLLTVDIGVVFLMETAKIEDMIVNSVALAFILSIDELIFESLMPTMAKHMIERVDDFTVQREQVQAETYWARDAVAKHRPIHTSICLLAYSLAKIHRPRHCYFLY